jgi:hypothetical protein
VHYIDYEGSILDDIDENLYDTIREAKEAIIELIEEWNNKTDSFVATVYKINIPERSVTKVFEKRKKRPQYYQQAQSSQSQYQQQQY